MGSNPTVSTIYTKNKLWRLTYDNAKRKQRKLKEHFGRYIDYNVYPNFEYTDDIFMLFYQVDCQGKKLSGEQKKSIEPLIWAKKTKEITIETTIYMMKDCVDMGFSGISPLIEQMDYFEDVDPIMYKSYNSLYKSIQKQGISSIIDKYR